MKIKDILLIIIRVDLVHLECFALVGLVYILKDDDNCNSTAPMNLVDGLCVSENV